MAYNFKKLFAKDGDVNRLQANIDDALKVILNLPWMGGVFVDVTLAPGVDNVINHGLAKVPSGYIPVMKDATTDVWTSTTMNNLPEKMLLLRSTASANVKLWIY